MTILSKVHSKGILACDGIAERYDDLFARSKVGRAQREAIQEVLIDTFCPGDSFWR